jgi:hypothetical protein
LDQLHEIDTSVLLEIKSRTTANCGSSREESLGVAIDARDASFGVSNARFPGARFIVGSKYGKVLPPAPPLLRELGGR